MSNAPAGVTPRQGKYLRVARRPKEERLVITGDPQAARWIAC